MQRLTDRVVEYTDDELIAVEYFNNLLDAGYNTTQATRLVEKYWPTDGAAQLDPAFIAHLGDRD